jgi:hypothetical protein
MAARTGRIPVSTRPYSRPSRVRMEASGTSSLPARHQGALGDRQPWPESLTTADPLMEDAEDAEERGGRPRPVFIPTFLLRAPPRPPRLRGRIGLRPSPKRSSTLVEADQRQERKAAMPRSRRSSPSRSAAGGAQ